MSLKRCILLIAKYCGLFALSRRVTARQVRVLAYHGIWLGDGHFGNFLYMSADKFAQRMALLKNWGFPIVPLSTLESEQLETLPNNATVITIDDGWHGTYRHMVPVLEQYGFPATIYLTTYYCLNNRPVANVALQYCLRHGSTTNDSLSLPRWQLGPLRLDTAKQREVALQHAQEKLAGLPDDDARQSFLADIATALNIDIERIITERWFHLMTESEVRDAAQRGIGFELHTHRHRIDGTHGSCLTDEIETNRAYLQALTGRTPRHFCYPSGVYSKRVWPELEACDVATATTTKIGLVSHKAHPYALPRILDGQAVSDLEFEAEMSGFCEVVRHLRNLGF